MSSTLLTFRKEYDTIQETAREGAMSAQPNMKLANFLKQRMREIGIEQKELTDTFGISKGTASRWLNGFIGDPPELPTFVAFSTALQTPLWRLLEQAGYEIEQPTDPGGRYLQLARQLEVFPWIVERLDDLMRLSGDEFQELMDYLDFRRRGRSGDQSMP